MSSRDWFELKFLLENETLTPPSFEILSSWITFATWIKSVQIHSLESAI